MESARGKHPAYVPKNKQYKIDILKLLKSIVDHFKVSGIPVSSFNFELPDNLFKEAKAQIMEWNAECSVSFPTPEENILQVRYFGMSFRIESEELKKELFLKLHPCNRDNKILPVNSDATDTSSKAILYTECEGDEIKLIDYPWPETPMLSTHVEDFCKTRDVERRNVFCKALGHDIAADFVEYAGHKIFAFFFDDGNVYEVVRGWRKVCGTESDKKFVNDLYDKKCFKKLQKNKSQS